MASDRATATEEQLTLSHVFLDKAAEYLRVMAHPARLRMGMVLSAGPLPVHKIAEACNLPPNQACEHLRLLKRHGLLGSERRGRRRWPGRW